MAESAFEKTEPPTPRRLEEARQSGNVARSADFTAACVLLSSVFLLYLSGPRLIAGLRRMLEYMLRPDWVELKSPVVLDLVYPMRIVVGAAGPLIVGVTCVALVATVAQVGFILTGRPLQPNFARMSPIQGLKRLVDIRAGVRLAMSLAKVLLIASVAAVVIVRDVPRLITLAELETKPLFASACWLVFALGVKLALLLLVLAVLDLLFQRWQRLQDLRMTKQDVKEELKRMEGDPLIKQRRTRVARQLALQRISHAVPTADVVVTNPTHYAVALKYDGRTMRAPKVVAKGADYLAMRIRQLAALHSVLLVERRDLAQAMYKTVEVGQEVPPQYYNAVAEIMAYVYRLGDKKSA